MARPNFPNYFIFFPASNTSLGDFRDPKPLSGADGLPGGSCGAQISPTIRPAEELASPSTLPVASYEKYARHRTGFRRRALGFSRQINRIDED